jgi:hypothetical protein
MGYPKPLSLPCKAHVVSDSERLQSALNSPIPTGVFANLMKSKVAKILEAEKETGELASLEHYIRQFRVVFRLAGRKHSRTLKTKSEKAARATLACTSHSWKPEPNEVLVFAHSVAVGKMAAVLFSPAILAGLRRFLNAWLGRAIQETDVVEHDIDLFFKALLTRPGSQYIRRPVESAIA